MNILLVHNYYKHSGGEDAVLANEQFLLSSYGHTIHLHTISNEFIRSIWQKIQAAWQTPYCHASRKRMTQELAQLKPDIVHIHNFFPLLTPSIYDACQKVGVPVVQTLHNYRTICPGALLMRNGCICEDCVTGSAYQSVLHGCYRASRLGSFAVARMVEKHRKTGTWCNKVDRFIALTEFAKNKFVKAGFPAKKIAVKPNFYDDKEINEKGKERKGALFVGRLSREKGIGTLLKAWHNLDISLRLVGDGPLIDVVQRRDLPMVSILGRKPAAEVAAEMRRAAFFVMPSECYENFPLTLAEAFAHGLPVIASCLGAMTEIVEDGATGLHFEAGNAADLAKKVCWMQDHPEVCKEMSENARRVYLEKYTPEINYKILMKIYHEAIESHV